MQVISQYSYIITSTAHSDLFVKTAYKAACGEAERISRQFQCTTRVYRIVLDNGCLVHVEEAKYTNGE